MLRCIHQPNHLDKCGSLKGPQPVLEPDLDLQHRGAFAGGAFGTLPPAASSAGLLKSFRKSLCRSRSAPGWTGRTVWWLKPRPRSVRCIAERLIETPNRSIAQAAGSSRRQRKSPPSPKPGPALTRSSRSARPHVPRRPRRPALAMAIG